MPKPIASLSLDLDNKWSYLKTHGNPDWEKYPSYLGIVVPRFLDLLDKLGLRITVFVVGQDAAMEQHHEVLASIADAGHEIGNHSFHHEPWLHLYSDQQIEDELTAADIAIERATGTQPIGFRGPGYSISPAVLASLVRRRYQYDASTLPTFIGPLARSYYFFTARLTAAPAMARSGLFGSWRDAMRPIRPYWWPCDDVSVGSDTPGRLLEIPVTTMPIFRVPIHVSYLLYLRQFSRVAAWTYWRTAMGLCRLTGVEPSLLLHPLDILGADDDHDLAFFPAMRMNGPEKIAFVRDILADYSQKFDVMPICEHYAAIIKQDRLSRHAAQGTAVSAR